MNKSPENLGQQAGSAIPYVHDTSDSTESVQWPGHQAGDYPRFTKGNSFQKGKED